MMIKLWERYYEEFGMFGIVAPIVIQILGSIDYKKHSFDWRLFVICITVDAFWVPFSVHWIESLVTKIRNKRKAKSAHD